jgi:hypothetical protein
MNQYLNVSRSVVNKTNRLNWFYKGMP